MQAKQTSHIFIYLQKKNYNFHYIRGRIMAKQNMRYKGVQHE